MSIYISKGKRISKEEYYRSEYNDMFIAAYTADPENLHKALAAIKTKGCGLLEACKILAFVLGMSLAEANLTVQETWYKAD